MATAVRTSTTKPIPVTEQPVTAPVGAPGTRPNQYPTDPLPDPNYEAVPGYDPNALAGLSGGGYTAQLGPGGTATATTRSVGSNELVANQLEGLTESDSKYIAGARRRAGAGASARGLGSSSIAAGNAEAAAIDAALPIASQDASTYGRTASENMGAENAASLANAGNATSFGIAGLNADTSLRETGMRTAAEREQSALGRNATREANVLNRNFSAEQNAADRQQQLDVLGRQETFTTGENERQRRFTSEEAQRDFRRQAIGAAFTTAFSDPSFMRDPAGVEGLVNFVTQRIDRIDFGQIYNPGG